MEFYGDRGRILSLPYFYLDEHHLFMVRYKSPSYCARTLYLVHYCQIHTRSEKMNNQVLTGASTAAGRGSLFGFSSSSDSRSIDLSSRSNLAFTMRRIIYSTVAAIQNPMHVSVAISRDALKCKAIAEQKANANVTYGKNKVIEGAPVAGSCKNGQRTPSVDHCFHLSDIHDI